MNSQEYSKTVRSKFGRNATIRLDTQDLLIAYEEVFKWQWFATKLKITSFVKQMPSVSLSDIESYSASCLKQAIKEKKGLPIGIQNGVVSFSVIVSENISSDAIIFVQNRPKKHFAAFEMPVLFVPKSSDLYFYQGDIVWGMLYVKFFREYITSHFRP